MTKVNKTTGKPVEPAKTEVAHNKAVDARAEQLSLELKTKVWGISFPIPGTDKFADGYFKEAGRLSSIDAADFAITGRHIRAGHILFPTCFLREHSNEQIEKNDAFYRTACYMLGVSLQMAIPDIKKN